MAPKTAPPILFRGAPAVPPPEVFEEARKGHPLWLTLLEDAASQFARLPEHAGIYADPLHGNGATVEQVWLFFTMLGVRPYCLLAHPLPKQQTARIERLVPLKAFEIVNALRKLQGTGELSATTMIYDGQTGHCITLLHYDPSRDRFVFYDPWPLKSMLSQENNVLGIDAENEGAKTRWSVTAEEMESVLFATMLLPVSWARLQGIAFDQMFDAWTHGDFFQFFNVKQVSRSAADGIQRCKFSVGPFKKNILLEVNYTESGKIVAARLAVDTAWMIDNWVITLDLIASFVMTFAPPPDADEFARLAGSIRNLSDPKSMIALRDSAPNESMMLDCLRALVGLNEESSVFPADFADLTIALVDHGKKSDVTLRFELQ